MAGVWVIVDEDGRGHAVRQAVGAQTRLLAVADPFSARRALASEPIAGLIVCVGKRTLSLRSLCSHVRREFPKLPVIAVRHPGFADDKELVAVVTDVIDDGDPEDVTDNLARVSSAFEAGEATAVLPHRPMPAPPRTAPKGPPAKAAGTPTPARTGAPPGAPPGPPPGPPAVPPRAPAMNESFPPVVIGALEPEVAAHAVPTRAPAPPPRPVPSPILAPAPPTPLVPVVPVAPPIPRPVAAGVSAQVDPFGAPTERHHLPPIVAVAPADALPTLAPIGPAATVAPTVARAVAAAPAPSPPPVQTAPKKPAPWAAAKTTAETTRTVPSAAVSQTLEEVDDDLEAPEPTAITGGPNLTEDAVTETHVGVAVGSSLEHEEARETLDGSGPALLVQIAASRRTGRLMVSDGEGAGTIHWANGEPVGAELPTGDGGLYRRLVSSGLIPAGTSPPLVPQGRLLLALVKAGLLGEPQRLEFEKGVLRDQVLAVSRQSSVRAVFVVSSAEPPAVTTRMNVFGLVLEARRRTVAPEVVAALYEDIAGWQLTGTSVLAQAAHLVAPFAGGRDITPLLVQTSARQLIVALDWDRTMGTLVLMALRDAGLILVSEAPPKPAAAPVRVTRPTGLSPRQLLGVGMAPDEDEIEVAYARHIARIDQDLLRATTPAEKAALHALRERFDVARQALRLQLGFATAAGTNPF